MRELDTRLDPLVLGRVGRRAGSAACMVTASRDTGKRNRWGTTVMAALLIDSAEVGAAGSRAGRGIFAAEEQDDAALIVLALPTSLEAETGSVEVPQGIRGVEIGWAGEGVLVGRFAPDIRPRGSAQGEAKQLMGLGIGLMWYPRTLYISSTHIASV